MSTSATLQNVPPAVLDGIDWAALARRLEARASSDSRAAAAGPEGLDHHLHLAVLVGRNPVTTAEALAVAAPGLSGRECIDLAARLGQIAVLVWRHAHRRRTPAVPLPPVDQLGLVLDDEARQLGLEALLPLAGDIAADLGVLTVVTAGLGGARGCVQHTATGALIVLDPAGNRPPAETFAHELGHVLDPHRMAQVTEEGERFAEALGQLLLQHRPATVAEAVPFIAQALADRPPADDVPGYEGLDAALAEADLVDWFRSRPLGP